MRIGVFFVLKSDVAHYLHAAALVRECRALMPHAEIVQLTNQTTAQVPGAAVVRQDSAAPLLEQRLRHYAACQGEWLLIDTDTSMRQPVDDVFDDPTFDVALVDRDWPHLKQGERMLHDMPFNTGVVFSRCPEFWAAVLEAWLALPDEKRQNWLSEQQAVYAVVRTGRFRVKILPGMTYNYPPKAADDAPPEAAILHFKGERKIWRSALATATLSTPCA